MKSHVYLTFDGECVEAFNFYKAIFNVKFTHFMKVKDSPMKDKMPEALHDKVMHCSLPITSHMELMGCDHMPMHKRKYTQGTNVQISLAPSTIEESDDLYKKLSQDGGEQLQPMAHMFWGSYFGFLVDRFGVFWMIDCHISENPKDQLQNSLTEMRASIRAATDVADNLEKLVEAMPNPNKKAKHN